MRPSPKEVCSTLQQVLHISERQAPEVLGVLVGGFAVKAFVTDGESGLLSGPIKTQRDDSVVLRQIWKPRKTGPVAVLQKSLALDGKHGAAIPVCILVQFAGDLDAGAEPAKK